MKTTSLLIPPLLLALSLPLTATPTMATPSTTPAAPQEETATPGDTSRQAAMLATLAESRRLSPEGYALVLSGLERRTRAFLSAPLKPVDMSKVRGQPYGNYSSDVWRISAVAGDLHAACVVWLAPGSTLQGDPALKARIDETFAFVVSYFLPSGEVGAPDGNIDRFILNPLFESYLLAAPSLPTPLHDSVTTCLKAASNAQLAYLRRSFPWGGGYPNMDAAFALVAAQAKAVFGGAEFDNAIATMMPKLEQRLIGATHEYVAGHLPDPGYTGVVLSALGRIWQLTGDETARRQIAAHVDYYARYMEPGGVMDRGMSPPIKHDWIMEPFAVGASTLELVQRIAPSPALSPLVAAYRAAQSGATPATPGPLALYFLAPEVPAGDAAWPASFFVTAHELGGFHARTVRDGRTLSYFLNGKETSADTRVSVMGHSAKTGNAAFGGVFTEVIQNGLPYFMSPLHPWVERFADSPESARVRVTHRPRAFGPGVQPMVLGEHIRTFKDWKFAAWDGGSPDSPPVEVVEDWTLTPAGLSGRITLTALKAVKLDGVRVTAAPALTDLTAEERLEGNGVRARYGVIGLTLRAISGPWAPLERVEAPRSLRPMDEPDRDKQLLPRRRGFDVRWRLVTRPLTLAAGDQLVAEVTLGDAGESPR